MAELQVLDGGTRAPGAGEAGARAERGPVRGGASARHLRPVRPGERASGPRPSRPHMSSPRTRSAVSQFPVSPGAPACSGPVVRRGSEPRTLARPVAMQRVLPPHIVRRRRVAAAVGLAAVTMLAVLLLGLLADVAAAARAGGHVLTDRSPAAVVPASGQGIAPLPR